MSVVNALLNTIVAQTGSDTETTVTGVLTPAPTVITGAAQIFISNIVVDTSLSTVSYNYLIVQYYNTNQIAFLEGTTKAISIPGISATLPTVSVTAVVTGSIVDTTISFSIASNLNYSKITPLAYNVEVQ
jgi:hypothetical protein